jgi:hypothetical protein
MAVYLDSLSGESLVRLDALGIGGRGNGEEKEELVVQEGGGAGDVAGEDTSIVRGGERDGRNWFERISMNSGGGRVKVNRGAKEEGKLRILTRDILQVCAVNCRRNEHLKRATLFISLLDSRDYEMLTLVFAGGQRIEWEIMDWTAEDEKKTEAAPGKRKLGDVEMEEVTED